MPSTLIPRAHRALSRGLAVFFLAASLSPAAALADGLSVHQLTQLRSVRDLAVSPGGDVAAYGLQVHRVPGVEADGRAHKELHVLSLETGESRGYVTGEVDVLGIQFSADGKLITYGAARFGGPPALWAIPVDGGESRKILERDGVEDYKLSPAGGKLALLIQPSDEARQAAIGMGYDREVFEEEWLAKELWIVDMPDFETPVTDPGAAAEAEETPASEGDGGESGEQGEAESDEAGEDEGLKVALEGSVESFRWSADGRRLVAAVAPRNLVDDSLMFRRLRVVDTASGDLVREIDNPGKLGEYALSPNGSHVALISGVDINDPREGRLMVAAVDGEGAGELRDLMPDYLAHVTSIVWRDDETLLWVAAEGSEATFGSVDLSGNAQKLARSSQQLGVPVMNSLHVTLDGTVIALGHTPSHPQEVFSFVPGGRPKRLTDSNPWLAEVELAKQEVISWTASDGLEIEGVLIHPLDGRKPAPLLLMVHGGPESNDWNGWVSNYSRPGQVAAAKGYAVLYPNYRGSTGRGVEFSKLGQSDAAGAEFRDLVEAVDHMAAIGLADKERVGITGGSYGGYATAWGSTFYTDYFKAGVMFVGISNKSSKGFTTDIPQEDVLVHTRFNAWEKWQFGLERSPIYHAQKSKTPLLIATGTADTRVHPSQSLQLYRALKLMGKTVRFVRYPGEPHGNRRATSREDYARRLLRWMDHFVVGDGGELPPVELD